MTAPPSPVPAWCAGCGERPGAAHPWGCPVAVRLSARLLSAGAPAGWRGWAMALAAGHPPHSGAARHWRRAAGAAAPAGPVIPLAEEAGGVRELALGEPETVAGAAPLVARVRAALLAALPGCTLFPPALGTLAVPDGVPDDDPSSFFDCETDEWPSPSPDDSPPPTT